MLAKELFWTTVSPFFAETLQLLCSRVLSFIQQLSLIGHWFDFWVSDLMHDIL